jgi:hypothetical protein
LTFSKSHIRLLDLYIAPKDRLELLTMSNEQLVPITVCAKRNPKLSKDDFDDHWANKHGPLVTFWLQHHNCVKYVQVRTSAALASNVNFRK